MNDRILLVVRWVGICALLGGIGISYARPEQLQLTIIILVLGALTTIVSFLPRNLGVLKMKDDEEVKKFEVSKDKYEEATQIATLLTLNINILYYLSKKPNMTVEQLQDQILHLYEDKQEIIKDSEVRKDRFSAAGSLFST